MIPDPTMNRQNFLKRYRGMTVPGMKHVITCQRLRIDSYRFIFGDEWPALINSLEDDITEMVEIMQEVHNVHFD